MKTDTSEKGLESLIVADMTAAGWIAGSGADYNREYGVDLVQLRVLCMRRRNRSLQPLT
jgi:type I restriction enzyme, R subunit